MTTSKQTPQLRHDDLYQMLVDLHEGRSEEESRKINAKLILALMDRVGDSDAIREAISLVEASSRKWSASPK